jgi:hypothetical protein
VRVNFKDRRILGQGVTDHLIGRSPSQGFEMLGKIISGDEGQDMALRLSRSWSEDALLRDIFGTLSKCWRWLLRTCHWHRLNIA